MRGQGGFFDVDERLKELSAKGDQLERLSAMVNFERNYPGPCGEVVSLISWWDGAV